MTGVDPLAIDIRGWDPRKYGDMCWQDEPQIAFIAPPKLTGASKADIVAYSGAFDNWDFLWSAEWINIRVRRVWYRWVAPEIAYDLELDTCPCRDRMWRAWRTRAEPRFEDDIPSIPACVAGEAMCGRHKYRSVSEFWQEDGHGCPWLRCERTDPMAVKWIHVWDCVGSDGP